MKNKEVLTQKIEEAIKFISDNDKKLKPIYELLLDSLSKGNIDEVPFHVRLDAFIKIQEQYTNSILLLTKLKEIIDFNDFD